MSVAPGTLPSLGILADAGTQLGAAAGICHAGTWVFARLPCIAGRLGATWQARRHTDQRQAGPGEGNRGGHHQTQVRSVDKGRAGSRLEESPHLAARPGGHREAPPTEPKMVCRNVSGTEAWLNAADIRCW